MAYIYVAVDLFRQKILVQANSSALLNQKLLSEEGQHILQYQAVWLYKMTPDILRSVKQEMRTSGKTFAQVTRPQMD